MNRKKETKIIPLASVQKSQIIRLLAEIAAESILATSTPLTDEKQN